jgi:hypothetical protein
MKKTFGSTTMESTTRFPFQSAIGGIMKTTSAGKDHIFAWSGTDPDAALTAVLGIKVTAGLSKVVARSKEFLA